MRKLARKWKRALLWIVLMSVLVGSAMAVYTYTYEQDRYSAAYTFFAMPLGVEDQSALQAARMLAMDCEQIVLTESFREAVLAKVTSDGNCSMKVLGVDGTHLIGLQVTGIQPRIVMDVANGAGEELSKQASQTLGATQVIEVERAVLPSQPSAPNRPCKIAWAFLVAFAIGSLLSFLFGDGNEYVHAGFDTQSYIAEAPYLGAVLTCKKEGKKFYKKSKRLDKNCMLLGSVNRLVLESVRCIAVILRSKEHAKNSHLVTVTSLRPDEGKSVFVALLASELASQGFRVLVIDLQGKSDAVEKMLGAYCQYDLSEYISRSKSLTDVTTRTGNDNLMLISSKREKQTRNSIAYHPRFAELLKKSTDVFDFLIVNTAPISRSWDAAMVGAQAGSTILTAMDGASSIEQVNGAVHELRAVVNHMMGVVITETQRKNIQLFSDL